MKNEALKLADDLKCILQLPLVEQHKTLYHAEAMIRRLVEELDKKTKPLSDDEIWKIYNITGLGKGMAVRFAKAILERAKK